MSVPPNPRFARQIASALRLIAKNGLVCSWVKQNVAVSGGQPWKLTQVANPPTFQVSIVFLSSGSSFLNALSHLINGTSIPTGAPRGLMGAVPFIPEVTDKLIWIPPTGGGNQTLIVKGIDPVAPNGRPILYKIDFE